MTDIAPGWEIVAQKTRRPVMHMALILLQMLMVAEPLTRSDVTFTVRRRTTRETRQVTANSREAAAAKIEQGLFDRA
jgi:hypothetical protein